MVFFLYPILTYGPASKSDGGVDDVLSEFGEQKGAKTKHLIIGPTTQTEKDILWDMEPHCSKGYPLSVALVW